MAATPYGRTETAQLPGKVDTLRARFARIIAALDRLISEDTYQSVWVEGQTLYGISVPIARNAGARHQIETQPDLLAAIQNAFQAAGWDHVEYDLQSGTVLLLLDPERAVEIELDDGTLVRDIPPEGKSSAEWAEELIDKPIKVPHPDGTWSVYPSGRIRCVRWPASRIPPGRARGE